VQLVELGLLVLDELLEAADLLPVDPVLGLDDGAVVVAGPTGRLQVERIPEPLWILAGGEDVVRGRRDDRAAGAGDLADVPVPVQDRPSEALPASSLVATVGDGGNDACRALAL
jgi:hypothetical protein